jgi:hypothetical protein
LVGWRRPQQSPAANRLHRLIHELTDTGLQAVTLSIKVYSNLTKKILLLSDHDIYANSEITKPPAGALRIRSLISSPTHVDLLALSVTDFAAKVPPTR